MRIIDLPAGGPHPLAPIVIDDGHVGVHAAGTVRVFDIRGAEPRMVLELPDVLAATAAGRILMTLDKQGLLSRWERSGDRWTQTARFPFADSAGDSDLKSSVSGRFAFVDGAHGLLVDLEGERIVTELDAAYGTARPCFDRLPDGRDVLFVAAPGYMSVRMIDAVRGDRLGEYEESHSTDFCHVEFRLTPDASRLVTFGCIWAWPYEVKIYDVGPWTRGSPPARGFPLPLVRTIEPIVSNTLLAAHVDRGGIEVTSACIEVRAELLSDEDGERTGLEALREGEPEVAAQLARVSGDDPFVLIARRIDPRDGRTVSSSVHAIPRVDEREVHYADAHRIVVAGPRLLVCNALDDRLVDHGELRVAGPGTTAVTRDGTALLVVRP